MTLGGAVQPVLEALDEAGRGRFRGIRHNTAWDASPMGNNAPRPGMLAEEAFRDGVRTLGRLDFSFDAMGYHTQLEEMADMAAACPDVRIVANHLGIPLAGGPYKGRADDVRAEWHAGLTRLAASDNVVLKVGALIRPLTGDKWDRRGVPATSEEIAAAWGDDIRFAIDDVRAVALPLRVELPRRQGVLRVRRGVERLQAADRRAQRRRARRPLPRHGGTRLPPPDPRALTDPAEPEPDEHEQRRQR